MLPASGCVGGLGGEPAAWGSGLLTANSVPPRPRQPPGSAQPESPSLPSPGVQPWECHVGMMTWPRDVVAVADVPMDVKWELGAFGTPHAAGR